MAAVGGFYLGQRVQFTDDGVLVQGVIEEKYFEDTTMIYVVRTGPYHVTLVEEQYLTPISSGGGKRTRKTRSSRKRRLNRKKNRKSRRN
jgi:hypothetical protein